MDPGRARRRRGQVGPAPPHQRHLQHTSDASFLAGSLSRQASTPRALPDLAFSRPPSFPAGEPGRWEYSNTNYAMLGRSSRASPVERSRRCCASPSSSRSAPTRRSSTARSRLVGEVAYGDSFLGTNGATFLHPSASVVGRPRGRVDRRPRRLDRDARQRVLPLRRETGRAERRRADTAVTGDSLAPGVHVRRGPRHGGRGVARPQRTGDGVTAAPPSATTIWRTTSRRPRSRSR